MAGVPFRLPRRQIVFIILTQFHPRLVIGPSRMAQYNRPARRHAGQGGIHCGFFHENDNRPARRCKMK